MNPRASNIFAHNSQLYRGASLEYFGNPNPTAQIMHFTTLEIRFTVIRR